MPTPAACLESPMTHPHARTEILIGIDGLARLRAAHVLVAGLGGVGGAVAEALGRAGIGRLTLLDHDVVAPSNLNRQLLALHSTLGQPENCGDGGAVARH
jgi:tRNA A37 threonylcarbamoyladenosine dehydratase